MTIDERLSTTATRLGHSRILVWGIPGQTHCYVTDPFFLIMAIAVVLHGSGISWLGANGWTWLAITIVMGGFGVLWLLPERIWGKFARFPGSTK